MPEGSDYGALYKIFRTYPPPFKMQGCWLLAIYQSKHLAAFWSNLGISTLCDKHITMKFDYFGVSGKVLFATKDSTLVSADLFIEWVERMTANRIPAKHAD